MAPLLRPRRGRRLRTLALLAAVIALLAALGVSGLAGQSADYQVYVRAEGDTLFYLARPREDLGDRPFHQLTPSWLPEGYTLLESKAAEEGAEKTKLIYGTENGDRIILSQWCGRELSGVAHGEYLTEKVTVHDCEGVFYAPADGGSSSHLLWSEGPYVLELVGELEREELLQIAEHLAW